MLPWNRFVTEPADATSGVCKVICAQACSQPGTSTRLEMKPSKSRWRGTCRGPHIHCIYAQGADSCVPSRGTGGSKDVRRTMVHYMRQKICILHTSQAAHFESHAL